MLSEDEKRLYKRKQTKKKNLNLYQAAKNAGVENYDKFTNFGYKGLYNGETADDIFKRKKLRYREDILDNMGSVELSANEFRISQTEDKLKRDNIKTESEASNLNIIFLHQKTVLFFFEFAQFLGLELLRRVL